MPAHLSGVKWCSLFAAPEGRTITPVRIRENTETVEILTGGRIFFKTGSEDRTYARGTIFWHQSGEWTIHRTPMDDPYRCAVFHFEVTERACPAPRVSHWHDEAGSFDKFFSDCLDLFHRETLDRRALGDYAYGVLLRHALYRDAIAGEWEGAPKALARALDFIRRHLSSGGLSVSEIASSASVSEPYLYALFSRHLGKSPHAYWLEQRLDKARVMLAGGVLPIKVVARECGFESIEVFYRRFRAHSGMSPGDYRRRYTLRDR